MPTERERERERDMLTRTNIFKARLLDDLSVEMLVERWMDAKRWENGMGSQAGTNNSRVYAW